MPNAEKGSTSASDISGQSVEAGNNGHGMLEIHLPRESHDLTFKVAAGATENTCKLIAFLSPKGGSGKTVLATNLGKILQLCGYNVLLLDADFTTWSLNISFTDSGVALPNGAQARTKRLRKLPISESCNSIKSEAIRSNITGMPIFNIENEMSCSALPSC